jgi:hypothetical protein
MGLFKKDLPRILPGYNWLEVSQKNGFIIGTFSRHSAGVSVLRSSINLLENADKIFKENGNPIDERQKLRALVEPLLSITKEMEEIDKVFMGLAPKQAGGLGDFSGSSSNSPTDVIVNSKKIIERVLDSLPRDNREKFQALFDQRCELSNELLVMHQNIEVMVQRIRVATESFRLDSGKLRLSSKQERELGQLEVHFAAERAKIIAADSPVLEDMNDPSIFERETLIDSPTDLKPELPPAVEL